MGTHLRKKHLTFKESERCESRYERKSEQPATGTPATTGPAKGTLNGKVPTSPAKQKGYNGEVRKDKVLVLLVEYADFKHNNIDKEPGYMYSNDFNQEHYEKCYLVTSRLR